MVDVFELWRVICRKLPILTYHTELSCDVVCVFLRLAISVEHRLETDRQTHDDGTYRAIMASHGKNGT